MTNPGEVPVAGPSEAGTGAAGAKLLRIGECVLDLSSGELEREGARHLLPEQPFRVLELLATHPHEVVTREMLKARLWPRNTFVDFDTGLNAAVRKLRTALGDDAEAPHYIETLPKRGYRCIASVEVIAVPEPVAASLSGDAGGAAAVSATPIGEVDATVVSPEGDRGLERRWARSGQRWHRPLAILAVLVASAFGALIYDSREPVEISVPATPSVASMTIAVLPFLNLSDEPGTEYFSDGLAEELLGLLARQQAFSVIARTSSFRFRDGSQDVREIGRLLGVRYVIEGSVRRDGEQVRTGAKLIDAENGFQLWADNYDHTLADLFAVQEDIATQVAQALQVVLVQGDGTRTTPRQPASVEAHLEYLKARQLMASWATSDFEAAASHLQRAIALDPDYAAAYAQLAVTILVPSFGGPTHLRTKAREAAAPLIDKALALDPGLGEAYITRSILHDDPDNREADLRRGLTLNPNYAQGYEMLADELYFTQGRREEAFAAIDRARVLDPLQPRNHYLKGVMYGFGGDLDAAEALWQQTLQLDPRFRSAYVRLGNVNSLRGQFAQAVANNERAFAIDPRTDWIRVELAWSHLTLGDADSARQLSGPLHTNLYAQIYTRIHVMDGDWRAAGELVYALTPEEATTDLPGFLAEVLLGHALVTGEYDRALEFAATHWNGDGSLFGANVTIRGWGPDDEDLAGALLRYLGHPSSETLPFTQTLRPRLEAMKESHRGLVPWIGYSIAVTAAVMGDREGALAALDEHFGAGTNPSWWIVRSHPAFAAMREDPRFKALIAASEAHAAEQRALLEEMRRDGRALPQIPVETEATESAQHIDSARPNGVGDQYPTPSPATRR